MMQISINPKCVDELKNVCTDVLNEYHCNYNSDGFIGFVWGVEVYTNKNVNEYEFTVSV